KQHGDLEKSDWAYFFHGLECDLKNEIDGRFLRLDFGPGGRIDTFTAWGVLQFIMTSVAPWQEFPQLRANFASCEPPWDERSGSLSKMRQVWDRLEVNGMFEAAAPELVELRAKYTATGPDGIAYVRFPTDMSEKMIMDCSVAWRLRLSP